jgi:hypothetical protein
VVMHEHTSQIACLISANLDKQAGVKKEHDKKRESFQTTTRSNEDTGADTVQEDYGPKMSELPDNTVYPSDKWKNFLTWETYLSI